jgi:hypothetical protein
MIQAILFHINKWTTDKARQYLKQNSFTPIKRVHITDKYLRYRITEPNYNLYNYIIKRGNNHIDYIIGIKI